MDTEDETIVALLHDVVEDTPITLDDLRDKNYSDEIVVAIDALTRRTGETYSAYIERLSNNKLARRVKIADLRHNLQPERVAMFGNTSLVKRYQKGATNVDSHRTGGLTFSRRAINKINELTPKFLNLRKNRSRISGFCFFVYSRQNKCSENV